MFSGSAPQAATQQARQQQQQRRQLLCALLAVPAALLGQTQAAQAAELDSFKEYKDDQDQFSISVPQSWQLAVPKEDYDPFRCAST